MGESKEVSLIVDRSYLIFFFFKQVILLLKFNMKAKWLCMFSFVFGLADTFLVKVWH